MPASFTTLSIKDGGGVARTIRAIDESGVGTGPYSFGTIWVDGSGTKQLAKEEDAAHTTADPGLPILFVRRDTTDVGSTTDGDYSIPGVDADGRVYVNVGSGAKTIAQLEDAAHTTADAGVAAWAVRRDTPAVGSNTDGDYSSINVDSGGWLRVTLGTGTKSAIWLESAAHTSQDALVAIAAVRRDTPAVGSNADGDYSTLNVDDTGWLRVTLGTTTKPAILLEDNAHTSNDAGVMALAVRRDSPIVGSNTDGDYSTLNVDDSGRLYTNIDGNTSHDAVDVGRPILLGARAVAHGSMSPVAADDRTRLHANRHGVLWTIGGHPNAITRSARVTDASGAQTNATIAGAIASGEKLVITRLVVFADFANTGAVYCKVGFGAATLPSSDAAGANKIIFEGQVPAGGGITLGDGSGVIAIGEDDEELRVTCDDPAGGAINFSFTRYVIES